MKNFILCFLLPIISINGIAQKNTPITIATYNIRLNTQKDGINAWPNRKELVKGLILFHEFDIFGIQEGFRGQLDDIAELTEFAFVGNGRDDGKQGGEHASIFFRKSRFKLLLSGDFWLSETPEIPGKGWDATCCNRICSWAKFKDLTTKKTFYVFNVHFDHQGVIARKESGKLMVKKIQEIAKNQTVILTGDFNSTPETEQIKHIQTILDDAKHIAKMPAYGPDGTFNGFKWDAAMKDRIDYIFMSKQVKVLKYGVLTDSFEQRYPSDHQPVVAKILID